MSPTRITSQLKTGLRISALIFVILVALVTILGKGGGGAPAAPPINQVPVANAISVSLDQGTSLPIDIAAEPGNALGNPPSSVSVSTSPTNGSAIVAGTTITYTPNPGFVGGDSFEYTITDADMETATATVSVEVSDAPPTASSLTPADASTGVARDTMVTATFSEAMDESTVSDSSFTLRDGQGATISATVMLDMSTNTATLTPDQALNVLTPYTATLSTAIMDLAGNALATAVSWSFTAVDGQWGMAALIEMEDIRAPDAFPQIAINAGGDALAVWQFNEGGIASVWANRYTAGMGWGTAKRIQPDDLVDALDAQVAIDANGNGVAVWQQHNGARADIWSSRYSSSSDAWGAPARIGTGDFGDESVPQIAMNASGDALAVWLKIDTGMSNHVYSSRYTAGGAWDMPAQINPFSGAPAASAQVAMDDNGNGLAVWSAGIPPQSIYANRYTAGAWGMDERIKTDLMGGAARVPQIAMDANGNALAVWQQSDGTHANLRANRYTAGAWGMVELVETGDAYAGQVAIDANGNALAVWGQVIGNFVREDLYASRYTAGSGWGTAGAIETDDAGSASVPQIAIDANGNALAIWVQDDGSRNDVWANRLE